ncbi:MAG TPA: hypothetical protein VNI77_09910 [Nitrososphaera sp.]|nr:hypothetical protein [Nitrososphaera sp.]
MVNKLGLILHPTCHNRSMKHDYALCNDKRPATPRMFRTWLTWGTRVPTRISPPVRYTLPVKKKRKKKKPTKEKNEQKRHNRKLARERVVGAHAIARIKRYGIVGIRFRNNLMRYDRLEHRFRAGQQFQDNADKWDGVVTGSCRWHEKVHFVYNYAIGLHFTTDPLSRRFDQASCI